MPVRFSSSSTIKWPNAAEVDHAVRAWAAAGVSARHDVERIGYFGSYARGDWGVGSDLDIVIVQDRCDEPFERRAAAWDTIPLPVPVDLIVYTAEELEHTGWIRDDVVWVFMRDATAGLPLPDDMLCRAASDQSAREVPPANA